ncbi:MAG: hypothetical protein J6B82_04175 [Bacteroidaceae bacterium]|nr:hypothetical protein [Bacteroidaceae bacterium]
MKRTHHLYYLLLTLLLLAGCNDPKHVTDTLTRAEALMDAHPDSAWTVLNTLSPDEMGQNRTRAHYALLYTQAQDKTYRDETNDSLISIAVDYYRHTDDARRKFLSYYYKGRAHFNAKDYQNATLCYMEAEQLADEVGDDYLVGLLYAELGRIYDIYYDYPKSLEAHQKAAECYERAGKIRHRNYMWLNQALVCRNLNSFDESERLLRMALNSAQKEGDNTLVKSCMGSLVMLYIEEKQMEKAQELYVTLESVAGTNYGSASFMGKIAQMYLSKKHFNQARQCLDKGWKRAKFRIDSVALYFSSAELLSTLGEDRGAYKELIKGVSLQTDEAHQVLQQPVLTAQRDYLSEKLKFEAYRIQMERRLRVLYILSFTILLAVVAFVLCRKLKKKKKVINELEQKKKQAEQRISSLLQQLDNDKEKADRTINSLKDEIAQIEKGSNEAIKMEALVQKLENDSKRNSEIITYLREELKSQEAEYHQYFDRLVETFRISMATMGEIMLDFEEIKAPNTFVENTVKQWKKNYFVGSKALRNLERLVNEFHDEAMCHFRKEVHFRNQEDYYLVCYLFAGVSIKVIAWLVSKSEAGIYQWRFRLRDKIESSDFKYKDLYLSLLSK